MGFCHHDERLDVMQERGGASNSQTTLPEIPAFAGMTKIRLLPQALIFIRHQMFPVRKSRNHSPVSSALFHPSAGPQHGNLLHCKMMRCGIDS
jgi:hypothetical protein